MKVSLPNKGVKSALNNMESNKTLGKKMVLQKDSLKRFGLKSKVHFFYLSKNVFLTKEKPAVKNKLLLNSLKKKI